MASILGGEPVIFNNITIENGWKDEDPRVVLSVAIGFLVVAFFSILASRLNKKRQRDKEKAIKLGHVIKAELVRHFKDGDKESGTYKYVVNGKTKRISVSGDYGVPLSYLYLYYVDSPEKAFSDYDDFNWGCGVGILMGIGTIILMLYLTGYFANP